VRCIVGSLKFESILKPSNCIPHFYLKSTIL
jgi:hypothetical protein